MSHDNLSSVSQNVFYICIDLFIKIKILLMMIAN
jgi:hypothetical protein